MKRLAKLFLIVGVLMIHSIQSIAQIKLALGKVHYIIPAFKQDSAATFNDWFVQHNIAPSIKASKYPFEIRYWFQPAFFSLPGEGEYLIIRGNKDSLFADLYRLSARFQPPQNKGGTILIKNNTSPHADIILNSYHIKPSPKLDSLVTILLENNIAGQPDEQALMADLKNKGVKLTDNDATDCCTPFHFQVKVGNKFRNFRANPYYYTNNPSIKEFANGTRLIEEPYNFDHWVIFGTYLRFR